MLSTSLHLKTILGGDGGGSTLRYLGDFPLDCLPPMKEIVAPIGGACLLVNSDRAGAPGEHWMAICVPPANQRRSSIFIEPFGLPLDQLLPPLRTWLEALPLEGIARLPYQIQPIGSILCGAYCAFCISHLPMYNYKLIHLTNREFDESNLQMNEKKMSKFWYKSLAAGR
jgi:hypothetical protein